MQTQLPSWVTRLGEFFKAPAVQWLPSPIPSPPRPRLLNMNVADQHGDMTGMSRSGAVGNAREDGFRVNSYPATKQQQYPGRSDPGGSSTAARRLVGQVASRGAGECSASGAVGSDSEGSSQPGSSGSCRCT